MELVSEWEELVSGWEELVFGLVLIALRRFKAFQFQTSHLSGGMLAI